MQLDPAQWRRFQRLRWSIYAILILAYMTVYFHRMAPGVVAGELMASFHTSGAALGSLAAMYYYIYTAMQVPAGVLADTLGPRVGVALACLVAGVGSILFGLAESFQVAAVGRFLVGLGVSVVFVGLMRSNTQWFSERYAGAISGATLLLGNLGSILAAGPLALLVAVVSWRDVFVGIGLLSFATAALTALVVRSRPRDAGFPSVREMEGLPPHPERHQHWLLDLRGVFATPAVWPVFFMMFGVTGSLFAFAGLWGVKLMQDGFGLERTAASLYTTMALAGFALGCLLMGAVSDYLGRRKPVIVGGCALAVLVWLGLILLPWGPGWTGLALFGLLGFSTGGFVVGYVAAKEVVPPGVAGMVIALVNTGLFLGAAIMQPAFGWALDLTWDGTLVEGVRHYALADYRHGLWLSCGFALLALVAAALVRETRCRNLTLATNFYEALSAEEKKVFDAYKANSEHCGVSPFAFHLNDLLRRQAPLDLCLQNAEKELDSMVSRYQAESDITLYRATFANLVEPHVQGQFFNYPAYMSTSTDKNIIQSFWTERGIPVKLTIHCSRGTPMALMEAKESHGSHEKERLLGRNARFEIIRHCEVDDPAEIRSIMGGLHGRRYTKILEYELRFVCYT